MSNVSNRHAIVPFIAGTSQPYAEQRLARVICKQTAAMTKAGKKALPSVCASIPMLPAPSPEQVTALMPAITAMLEDAQDGIIRARYEASHGSLDTITDDDISVDQCIAFLAAKAAGNRITAESVKAWFNASMADTMLVFIAEKLKFTELTPAVVETCNPHVNGYRELFVVLGAGKTILPENQLKQLQFALGLIDPDDVMAGRLMDRITSMRAPRAPKKQELLSLMD